MGLWGVNRVIPPCMHDTVIEMACDTRWSALFISDLRAVSVLVYRRGFLIRGEATRRLVLLDERDHVVDAHACLEGECVVKGDKILSKKAGEKKKYISTKKRIYVVSKEIRKPPEVYA